MGLVEKNHMSIVNSMWPHLVTSILVNIGLNNGLLPGAKKPLSKNMLIYGQPDYQKHISMKLYMYMHL